MSNFDDLKLSVEALSGGKNTVLFDDLGMPSIMVAIPKMYTSELIDGANKTVHPAFVVDNVEQSVVYISKYINITANDRAYSLPFKDPRTYVSFDQAVAACRKKGTGWGLTPFALWGAIALWCKKNDTMPHGNNNWGSDADYPHEKGIPTAYESTSASSHAGEPTRTATGSGPASWYHDNTMAGIADLNGNVWEWNGGLRLNNGEIQVIPYANCMRSSCDMSTSGTEWKAILPTGAFADGGATGTLKFDYTTKLVLSTTRTAEKATGLPFESLTAASSVNVPQLLKELAIYPADASGYKSDYFYIDNTGERLPLRGGRWNYGVDAGVFYCLLNYSRGNADSSIGFRSAFYKL